MSDQEKAPTQFHKRCIMHAQNGCTEWVHRNQKSCKACGAPGPWTDEGRILLNQAYVVTRNFSTMIGVQFMSFTTGQVLDDVALIKQLLAGDCAIKPRDETGEIHTCPHCGKPSMIGAVPTMELDSSGLPIPGGLTPTLN